MSHPDRERLEYGTLAPQVRAELARRGAAEPSAIAKALNLPPDAVQNALKFEVTHRRAARPFRGLFCRPDVAKAIQDAVKEANAAYEAQQTRSKR